MSRRPSGRFGIVLAAGRGTRFRGLKQFASLGGQPLLRFSLLAFERCSAVDGYVVVVNAARLDKVRRLAGRWHLNRIIAIVPGGRLRSDSVARGLRALPKSGWVAIHDAARPFITSRMLKEGFAACRRYRAATFGTPITDTVKQVHKRRILCTVDRSSLAAAQTPQFFELPLIRKAHALRGGCAATDDCSLVELLGVRPVLLAGTPLNIKVTTRADLRLCEALR